MDATIHLADSLLLGNQRAAPSFKYLLITFPQHSMIMTSLQEICLTEFPPCDYADSHLPCVAAWSGGSHHASSEQLSGLNSGRFGPLI
jgi:hypothetical protein